MASPTCGVGKCFLQAADDHHARGDHRVTGHSRHIATVRVAAGGNHPQLGHLQVEGGMRSKSRACDDPCGPAPDCGFLQEAGLQLASSYAQSVCQRNS